MLFHVPPLLLGWLCHIHEKGDKGQEPGLGGKFRLRVFSYIFGAQCPWRWAGMGMGWAEGSSQGQGSCQSGVRQDGPHRCQLGRDVYISPA